MAKILKSWYNENLDFEGGHLLFSDLIQEGVVVEKNQWPIFIFCSKRVRTGSLREQEILAVKKQGQWSIPHRHWDGNPVGDFEMWIAEGLIGLQGFELLGVREYVVGDEVVYIADVFADKFECIPESGVQVATWTSNLVLYTEGISREFAEHYFESAFAGVAD